MPGHRQVIKRVVYLTQHTIMHHTLTKNAV